MRLVITFKGITKVTHKAVNEVMNRNFWPEDVTEVVIGEGFLTIDDNVFCDAYKNLIVLGLPGSLRSIGKFAFYGCSSIVDLRLPDSLHTIGVRAFSRCSGIVDLHLPNSLRSIGNGAFIHCSDLPVLVIPNDCLSIGIFAFGHCENVTTLVIDSNRTSIGDGAFYGCSGLSHVLAPTALVQEAVRVFDGCPVLDTGLTPYSSVPLPRRTFWHPTMHAFCTPGQRDCVIAVLVSELRLDRQEEGVLPVLAHDLWLLILEFVPRHQLGSR